MARRSGRCLAVVGLLLTTALAGCTSARQMPARPAPAELGVVTVPERSGTFDVMGYPQLVAAGAGAVWVLCPPSPDATAGLANQGTLLRIDPDTGGRPVMRFAGLGDGSLAVGEGAVRVTEPADASLTGYALGSGQVSVRRPFGAGRTPVLMAVGEGFVWVSLDGPRPVLAKVDPDTMKVVKAIPLASAGGVAVGASRVWVSDPEHGLVGAGTAGLAVGEGSLWVLNWDRSLLTRVALGPGHRVSAVVRPATTPSTSPSGPVRSGSPTAHRERSPGSTPARASHPARRSGSVTRPKGVAVLAGSAWVANSGSRSVTRLSSP